MILFVFLISFSAILINLNFFGFAAGNDGPGWIMLSKYFLGQAGAGEVWYHRFFTPIYGLLGTVFPFWFINFFCLVVNSLLLYKLIKKLTNNNLLAKLSAILFTFDFQNLRQTLMITPDGLTWTFILLILNYALDNPKPLIWGLLLSLATLIKTNLGFFFPIYPVILLFNKDKRLILKTFIAGSIFLIIVGGVFRVIYLILHKTILNSAADLKARTVTPLPAYFLEFIPAFLYYWPFIIVGIMKNPFNSLRPVTVFFILTLIPLFAWSGVAARYHFTLFWFFIPLAAAGIIYIFKNKITLVVVILIFFIMGLLRQQMTLNGQSHVEFFKSFLKANSFIAK